jgi:hypothetical protein
MPFEIFAIPKSHQPSMVRSLGGSVEKIRICYEIIIYHPKTGGGMSDFK